MKRFLSISFTILLAFIFTYAGSGINAYSFCCDDCQSQGVKAIVEDKCCEIHHHNFTTEEEEEADTDVFCKQSHDECNLERVSLFLQEITTENENVNLIAPAVEFAFTTLL